VVSVVLSWAVGHCRGWVLSCRGLSRAGPRRSRWRCGAGACRWPGQVGSCREQPSTACPRADRPCSQFTEASCWGPVRGARLVAEVNTYPTSRLLGVEGLLEPRWRAPGPAGRNLRLADRAPAPANRVLTCAVGRQRPTCRPARPKLAADRCWAGVGRPCRGVGRGRHPTEGLGWQDNGPHAGPCPRLADCGGNGLTRAHRNCHQMPLDALDPVRPGCGRQVGRRPGHASTSSGRPQADPRRPTSQPGAVMPGDGPTRLFPTGEVSRPGNAVHRADPAS
jgi:hypothetical protein